MKTTRKNELA